MEVQRKFGSKKIAKKYAEFKTDKELYSFNQ